MTYIRRAILALVLSFGLAPAFAQVPAPVPALPDTERRTSYSITASTCACAVNFALYGDGTDFQNWVEVYIDGIRYNFNDASHGWTITSPSGSLANLARPITNAVLTFTSPQTGTVQIVGARRPRRTSQFNEGAGVPTRNLNQVFTDVIATMRETWDRTNDVTGRALLSAPGVARGLLPSPTDCGGNLLGFDVTGLVPNCVSNLGSGNVTMPVVDNHSAVFDGTTGRLKDGGITLLSLQSYPTLSDAASVSIPSNVNVVQTLGRNAVGDNGGGTYIRISPTTAAAWRFQSADGQWWGLNNRSVTPEMFGCFNGTDCTAVFQSMATWLMNFTGTGSGNRGGIAINFTPRSQYKVWPAGTTPAPLFNLTDVHGVTVNYNGASIVTDNLFSPQGSPYVFIFRNSSRLTFNGPHYEQTAYTTLSFTAGGSQFYFADQGSSDILFTNVKQKGGIAGIQFATSIFTGTPSSGITLLNGDFDTVFYPTTFNFDGDDFLARGVNCNNTGRCYFPYGVSNHDVAIQSNVGGDHDNVLLKQYANPLASPTRNELADITLTYRSPGRVNAGAGASLVALEMQQTVAPMTVLGTANNGSGKVRLTVDSTANAASTQTWNFAGIGGTTEANGTNLITVVDGTHIDLPAVAFVHAWTAGGYGRVPAAMKNIKIVLDVNDGTGNDQPTAFLTRKWAYDATPDVGSTNGYLIDGIDISGKIKNYNTGTAAIKLFLNEATPGSLGTWVGETIRNLKLHDLHVGGSSSAVTIDATNVTSMMLENVNSPSTVPWTVTDPNNVVRTANVSATGLTDRRTIIPGSAPANQWANGILASTGAIQYAQINFSDLAGSVACSQTPALTGDITKSSGSCATTLPTVNANVGTFGDSTHVGQVTVNAKGQVTAASNVVITGAAPTGAAGGDLTGTYPNPTLASIITAGGPTGSATVAPIITYDAKGRITAVSSATIAPAVSSITGLGAGTATALGNAAGGAGGIVVVNSALGTPSSGVATNLTGTASGLTAGNVTTNANLTGDVTSVGNAATLATAQPAVHTWALAQTFTVAPVFTDQSGSRTALGLGTMATQAASAVAITGGTLAGLTGLAVRDTSAAFDVTLAAVSSTTLTAGRTLTLNMGNVAHTLAFGTTANTITFPNLASFTVITNGDTGSVTNTMLAGSIAASKLVGTDIATVGTITAGTWNVSGGSVSAGTLVGTTSLTSPLHIGGSGTTGTQLTLQTTSGNGTTDAFAFKGGNNGATTFATLQTGSFNIQSGSTYSINGTSVLSGSTLGSGVTASSLTSVGTLTGGATGAGFTVALGSSTITGTLPLTNGGLAAALTASNGGIFYSTASAGAILAGTATARQMLQSGASAAPAWSTATWPATTTINQILYSSAANTVAGLATANSSILVTDGSGVPSLSTTLPAFTLGGTVSGGGNQVNNVVIGTSTPLAGTFTALAANTSLTVTGTNATTNNQNAASAVSLVNNSSGTSANATFEVNNGTSVIRFGMRGLNQSAYSILASNTAYIYGATDFITMSDGGNVIFGIAAGERLRVQSGGGINHGSTQATLANMEVGYNKITASGSAPGAGTCKEAWVAGTNAGTCKKIAYCGTSTTAVTMLDNVGAGC